MLIAALLFLATPPAYTPPRASDGHAELEGTWTNETLTRLERRPDLGDRLALTEAEVAETERPDVWRKIMRVGGQPRTSFITNPADGRVPPFKAGAQGDPRAFTLGPGEKITDNPEQQGIDDRCLLAIGYLPGPVMLPLPNNANYMIVQKKDVVAIDVEMIHDVRIIRINGPHRTDGIRPWLGDSIGHWEGDTLVVETTNFPQWQIFRGSWKNLRVTERFTRVAKDRLRYAFTVEDPTLWDQPWSGEYEMGPSPTAIEEYACHENEVSVEHMLSAARYEDEQARAGIAPKP
jgi:hypothetical protein